jgi:hypothetical protein
MLLRRLLSILIGCLFFGLTVAPRYIGMGLAWCLLCFDDTLDWAEEEVRCFMRRLTKEPAACCDPQYGEECSECPPRRDLPHALDDPAEQLRFYETKVALLRAYLAGDYHPMPPVGDSVRAYDDRHDGGCSCVSCRSDRGED